LATTGTARSGQAGVDGLALREGAVGDHEDGDAGLLGLDHQVGELGVVLSAAFCDATELAQYACLVGVWDERWSWHTVIVAVSLDTLDRAALPYR